MRPLELGRKLAGFQKVKEAQIAFTAALEQGGLAPDEELEVASYLLTSQGDYKVAYTTFVSLFNRGFRQGELLDIISQAFYFPNLPEMQKRYQENCRLLQAYPYCFREDFLPFEDLPIWFFPYDENGYIPYNPDRSQFEEYVDFSLPVIDRYFFKNLENPILAEDVYSQYQLEYLNDTVRKSEWIGKDNHIYLSYTDWSTFCAHLPCLDFRSLLKEQKFVFLFEDERSLYPIDFKARFGIDYSEYPVKPVGVREINRLIWHTQLSAHNGGDFFNEIFYGHPNLLALDSVMLDDVLEAMESAKQAYRRRQHMVTHPQLRILYAVKKPTDKDFFVSFFLADERCTRYIDQTSRIAPAIFFQPHFPNIHYSITGSTDTKRCVLHSVEYDRICSTTFFHQFRYIKTFTPMRRMTTSYAAANRFAFRSTDEEDNEKPRVMPDMLANRLLNRSFMVSQSDSLFRDSVLVRFEDGKLNPKATFSALAAFLDIPYTESMTYCSTRNGVNAAAVVGNAAGFDLAPVYNTYDEYADDADRAFLEYFMRDAYAYYGYDFHYYHGEPVDSDWIRERTSSTTHLDDCIRKSYFEAYRKLYQRQCLQKGIDPDLEENATSIEKQADLQAQIKVEQCHGNRVIIAETLQMGLRFVNQDGQPLKLIQPLKLDPALLEQPLYR